MPATGRRRIRWGRVLIVLVLLLTCAGYAGWRVLMTRSVTIRLEPAGYDLTYTMAWGMSMHQEFALSKLGRPVSGASSGWIELWKKPYDSGLSVYRTPDGSRYYLGTGYTLFMFDTASGELSSSCSPDFPPPFTELGQKLDFYRSYEVIRSLDPEGRSLFRYIDPEEQGGPVSDTSLSSRYYADLDYLGRFGLVRPPDSWPGSGSGRGDEVRFVPAGHGNEPRNSLGSMCG